jgi:MoaA/NifB/PqqE/SkfB family radical SAM enzyme
MRLKIKGEEEKLKSCIGENKGYQLQEIKIHVTKKCNSSCIMCDGGEKDPIDLITREEIRETVRQAKVLGLKRVKLFGGEPTLRKDLTGIVQDCTSEGVDSHITSNGLLIDKDLARNLISSGLGGITISLDSVNPEEYFLIRGTNSYYGVVGAIDNLKEERNRQHSSLRLQVNSVIMSRNYRSLADLVKFCIDKEVDGLSLSPITPDSPFHGRKVKNLSLLFLSEEQIREYNQRSVPEGIGAGIIDKFGLSPERLFIFGTTSEEISRASKGLYVNHLIKNTICLKPWYFANINEKGDFIPCNHVKEANEFPIGNIRESSVQELWDSKKFKEFRMKSKPIQYPSCRFCCYSHALDNFNFNLEYGLGVKNE